MKFVLGAPLYKESRCGFGRFIKKLCYVITHVTASGRICFLDIGFLGYIGKATEKSKSFCRGLPSPQREGAFSNLKFQGYSKFHASESAQNDKGHLGPNHTHTDTLDMRQFNARHPQTRKTAKKESRKHNKEFHRLPGAFPCPCGVKYRSHFEGSPHSSWHNMGPRKKGPGGPQAISWQPDASTPLPLLCHYPDTFARGMLVARTTFPTCQKSI